MNTIIPQHAGPKLLAVLISIELLLLCGFAGLAAWTYTQSRTQHQICQAFGFVGQQIQHGIDTNSSIVKLDMAQGRKKDAAIRRQAISQATSFLIRVKRVQC